MATNVGLDNGHPYLQEGADDADLTMIQGRVGIVSGNRPVGFTLERSVDDGDTWEPVLDETLTGDGANLTDWESLSNGDTLYRATAFTVEGATAETVITVPADSPVVWLSGGGAFGDTARLPFDPSVKISAGRARTLKQYAGRSLPVAYVGEALNRTVAVSGTTSDREEGTASSEALTELVQNEQAVFLFRDPDGNRIYGMITSIDLPRNGSEWHEDGWNSIYGYSFTLTETNRGA